VGDRVRIDGAFHIEPALTAERREYLACFGTTRRMRRKTAALEAVADPLRSAVELPIGDDGGYFTGGPVGQPDYSHADPSIVDDNAPPRGQPSLWCPWVPSEDGCRLIWNQFEKPTHLREWLEYLLRHFLVPWGHTLTGHARWQSEYSDADRGTIAVTEGRVVRQVKGGPPLKSRGVGPAIIRQTTLLPMGKFRGRAVAATFAAKVLIGAVRQDSKSVVLLWDDLARPPRELATFAGVVERIVPDHAGSRAGLCVVQRQPSSYGSYDLAEVTTLDLGSGAVSPWEADLDVAAFCDSGIVWSPDGTLLAFGAYRRADYAALLRVVDATSGAQHLQPYVSESYAKLTPLAWHADGWLFAANARSTSSPLCAPHDGGPPRAVDELRALSPDGRCELLIDQSALRVRSRDADAPSISISNVDIRAGFSLMWPLSLRDSFLWLYPDRIALRGDRELYTVDVRSGSLTKLFDTSGTSLAATSSLEPLVVGIDPEWRFVLGRFDPQARVQKPRMDAILTAIESGAAVDWTAMAGRPAIRITHPDGSKQISVLTEEEQSEVRAAIDRRLRIPP
jgi:hypothetical protein